MAGFGESSSAASKDTDEKPVVVRVKRKAVQSLLEAFCQFVCLMDINFLDL